MSVLSRFLILIAGLILGGAGGAYASGEEKPREITYQAAPAAPASQSSEEAAAKSAGCQSCHTSSDAASMHTSPGVILGCVDCHGGSAEVRKPDGADQGSAAYFAAQEKAHVLPTLPESWHYPSSANPKGSFTLLNREASEYVRFVNPSDYRTADLACGNCHADIISRAKRSIMATGALLWGGASYNNGILPFKNYFLGEVYDNDGGTAKLVAVGEVTPEMEARGVRKEMLPLPAWEVIPPGDIFRVFIKEPSLTFITYIDMQEAVKQGAILLDVRTPDDYENHHLD
ncbi:MAG: hypothetical protein Q8L63_01475, partial [Alphaproteobacteria bacterium]|nr:hypothetical protein [Alphaproteobacteria bacterium]